MNYKNVAHRFSGGVIVLLALGGCKDVFQRIDCQTICESYKDCEDSSVKLGECADDCFDAIDGHKDLEEDADDCAHCIDDFRNRTCSEVKEDCSACDRVLAAFMGGAAGM